LCEQTFEKTKAVTMNGQFRDTSSIGHTRSIRKTHKTNKNTHSRKLKRWAARTP